ncbi:MAG: hypothetical protein JXR83_01575 [Deltaproteobacteria bacterium]|nr:hypothetical protein [Deltaproteobacteria bacterium]
MGDHDVTGDRLRLLADFYGTCAGLLREALARHVPAERLEQVEATLFDGIEPLPAGPALAAAVEQFLARLDALRTSDVTGVRYAFAALERQGLTPHTMQRIAALAQAVRVERMQTVLAQVQ